MKYQFDWIEKLPEDTRLEILDKVEELIALCEDAIPIELYDDDLLAGILDLRDELEKG